MNSYAQLPRGKIMGRNVRPQKALRTASSSGPLMQLQLFPRLFRKKQKIAPETEKGPPDRACEKTFNAPNMVPVSYACVRTEATCSATQNDHGRLHDVMQPMTVCVCTLASNVRDSKSCDVIGCILPCQKACAGALQRPGFVRAEYLPKIISNFGTQMRSRAVENFPISLMLPPAVATLMPHGTGCDIIPPPHSQSVSG